MYVLRILAVISLVIYMVVGWNPPSSSENVAPAPPYSPSASSIEWVKLNTSKNFTFYAKRYEDPDKRGNPIGNWGTKLVGGWIMFDYKDSVYSQYPSSTAYYEVNCETNQLRTLNDVYYTDRMATGKIVNQVDHPDESFQATHGPCSVSERIVQHLCGRKKVPIISS